MVIGKAIFVSLVGLAGSLVVGCGHSQGPSVTSASATSPTAAAPTTAIPQAPIVGTFPNTTTPVGAPTTITSVAPSTFAPPTTATTTTEVEPGPRKIKINVYGGISEGEDHVVIARGTEIELTVVADVGDEVHIHFYDVRADVTPTDAAVIRFVADVPGIFEVELEDSHLQLLEIEVR
jgi:hypothetical protein